MADAFALLLRGHRLRRRYTQEELAERAGISSRSVREIERGRGARPDTVERLATALELDGPERVDFVETGRALFWAGRAGRPERAEPERAEPERAEPERGAAPLRQLPPDVPEFVGRDREGAVLDMVLDRPGESRLAVVCGPPGVGKTALVVHWAHKMSDRFPDGQLYTNLQGFAQAAPVRPIDALAHFLQALGVPADQVPGDAGVAAGLYRSLLADKRVLVLLDNAVSPDQVRPLLPAGPGSHVLVTSRRRLSGLVAREGAHAVTLDVLPPDEARTLLERAVGAERVDAEPQAVADLVRLCACLPLALRIAAAHLVTRPQRSIGGYAASLSQGNRIAAFNADDDEQAVVRLAFDQSYEALPPEARRLFRMTGLLPVTDIGPAGVAALADVPVAEAESHLDQLSAAHLIHQHASGRFASHDLLRLYAGTLAEEEDSESARRAAVGRLLDWYLSTVEVAVGLLYPDRNLLLPARPAPAQVPRQVPGQPVATGVATAREALEWLDAERVNLVGITRYAAENGPRPVAWEMADALQRYFWNRGHAIDWFTVASAGHAAAEAAADLPAMAVARLNLGSLSWRQDQYGEAIEHCQAALRLAQRIGHTDLEAAALGQLGGVYRQAGRPKEAIEPLTRALTLDRETGRAHPRNLGRLGSVWLELGRLQEAADSHARTYAMYEALGAREGQAVALANLGETDYLLGRYDSALNNLDQAISYYQEVGNAGGEAMAMCCLARIHSEAGRRGEALRFGAAALALARDAGRLRVRANVLNAFADVQYDIGRPGPAAELHDQALGLARETGHLYSETEALVGLAACHHRLGHLDRALQAAHQALAIASQAGYRILECGTREVLADIHLARGEARPAAAEARKADALHDATGYRRDPRRSHVPAGSPDR